MSKQEERTVATFVAAPGDALEAAALHAALAAAGLAGAPVWLDDGVAADVFFSLAVKTVRARLRDVARRAPFDVIVQKAQDRRKALLVADMDSTMIGQECIDELADYAGLRAPISAITVAAMRGEIDFETALKQRVALLFGLRADVVDAILATRIAATPGARALVQTMRAHGAYAVLVSGGFDCFVAPVAHMLGFDAWRANRLETSAGVVTGRVVEPVLAAAEKRHALEELIATRGVSRGATLAVGDGANDLEMLSAAGLGVAFRAKPLVAAQSAAVLAHADLTALLYAQGFCRTDFKE